MAGCLNFSLIEYKDRQLHKKFEAEGLSSRMINVSNGSTIHCWVPKNFIPPTSKDATNANGTAVEGALGAASKSEKPVLVLLHGFGASATWQWEMQVKQLLPHFTLIIPDLVFFGLSTTTSSDRSESFQAECVWLVLCELGIEKFSVVGTSYGGFVAYRLTQAHEDAVDKIVLSNSSICMTPEDDRALCKRGGTATVSELLQPTTRAGLETVSNLAFSKPGASWFIPSFIINDYINVLYGANRAEKAELLKYLVFGKESAPSLLTLVDKNILMIWGDNDKVFPLEQAERAKNYFGKRSELVVLKDAGHVSQLEQPAKWNSTLVKFLLGIELA